MADFDVQTITAAGAGLIAAATASNKLIIDGCDATTEVLTKDQAVAVATRPASPGSNTTDVALAGSTDNHVYAYAEFIRGQSAGGDFNTFYLYGHSESSPYIIRVIAIASASSTVHLPTATDVVNRSEIQFELTFSATDEVVEVASSSMYETRGEFLLLKDRTVTTHAEGAATTGEAQSIYGIKTFKDNLKAEKNIVFPNNNENSILFQTLGYSSEINGSDSGSILEICSKKRSVQQPYKADAFFQIQQNENNYASLASLDCKGIENISLSIVSDERNYDVQTPGKSTRMSIVVGMSRIFLWDGEKFEFYKPVNIDSFNATTVTASSVVVNTISTGNQSNTIQLGSNIVAATGGVSIGESQNLFPYIYGNEIRAINLLVSATAQSNKVTTSEISTTDTNNNIQLDANIIAGDTGLAFGTSSYPMGSACFSGSVRCDSVYTSNIHSPSGGAIGLYNTIIANSTVDLGSDLFRFDYVYANNVSATNLYGCIRRPTGNTNDPPVGSIFLGLVYVTDSSEVSLSAGNILDFTTGGAPTPSGVSHIFFANLYLVDLSTTSNHVAAFPDGNYGISDGKFAVLSGGVNTRAPGSTVYKNYILSLLMRIE